jgi:L-proline dehydrogenase (EC 1.5.99.8)
MGSCHRRYAQAIPPPMVSSTHVRGDAIAMIPPIARRFVAGESVPAVVEHVRALARDDIGAICNLLGEHHTDPAVIDADIATYRSLAAALTAAGLDAGLSVKPSQVGLELGQDRLAAAIETLVTTTEGTVWVDMEDHTTTDATLEVVTAAMRAHPNRLGVCIQANLLRSEADLHRLAPLPGQVRLVKGAYDEPPAVAIKQKAAVDERYRMLLELLFREADDGIAVGSHDPAMIAHAEVLAERYGTPYELQMLTGVRESAQRTLAQTVPVVQYVPFGDRWLSYFYRRIRERKENALFAARAIIGR